MAFAFEGRSRRNQMIFARLIPPRVPAIRCHSRLFVNARTLAPVLLAIGTAIAERSNITIAIVSAMAGRWRRKALGWFLEFRTIPVLLWSYTSVSLGTALAFLDGGRIELVWFLVAMALAGLVQGWVTHAINEIFDWRSGPDRDRASPALSGGT